MNLSMRVLATAKIEAVAPEGGEAILNSIHKDCTEMQFSI